jgi:hypothetical protein
MALRRILVMAAMLLTASQGYANIIYGVNRTVGPGASTASVVGTITTDGTIGVLDDMNIVAFSLTLADGTYTVPITNVNGGTHFVASGNAYPGTSIGSPLTATATQLLFDFTSTGFVHFQLNPVDTGTPFWCLAGSASTSHCVSFIGGESIKTSHRRIASDGKCRPGASHPRVIRPRPGWAGLVKAGEGVAAASAAVGVSARPVTLCDSLVETAKCGAITSILAKTSACQKI